MTAVVVGAQVLLPGCGIPPLRHADPGPALPPSFEAANNLHYMQSMPTEPPAEPTPADSDMQSDMKSSDDQTAAESDKAIVLVACAKPVFDGDATELAGSTDSDVPFTRAGQPENWIDFEESATSSNADETTNDQDSQTANWVDFEAIADPGDGEILLAPYTETEDVDDSSGVPPAPEAASQPGETPDEPKLMGDDGAIDSVKGMYGDDLKPSDGHLTLGDNSFSWENSSAQPWFQFFNDPLLADLVQQALAGNQELKILSQQIRIANYEVLGRSGEYLPFVTVGAGAGIDKPGRFTREGAVEDQLEVAPGKSFPEPLPDFLVAANLSWELDIWRRLRNARDAAALRYLGTQDGQNYIVTRLVAEIAENYFELMALDNQMTTLDQMITIQEQSLKVAEAKKEAARGTALAVQRFQAEVRKNRSRKLIIQQQIVETENRINFLLGRYPQHVPRNSEGYIDLQLNALQTGVPSQLLRNRADVRQAERELEAAGLDVKVARARFYPSLNLNAGVGYDAFNPKYLFRTPESLIYSVAADLVAPLINKRAIKADYLSANAAQLQACYEYQRTILNAFTEVINRMAKVENYRQSIEIKKQQLTALEEAVDTATRLFINARAEYVEVLLAQRDMMEARMVLIETKQEQLSAIVNAYQALGGGAVQLEVQP